MPDRRRHRGAHPDDRRLFAEKAHSALRAAVAEQSWLLSRGYAETAALKLVGDHHGLTARQRMAVRRSGCSDDALARRARTERTAADCAGRRIGVDGYNLLITVESALSGGVILVGRDGCRRDLASLHGTYRKVDETRPAIEIIRDYMGNLAVTGVDVYLDRPVSNSGRLAALAREIVADDPTEWRFELVNNPDRTLAEYDGVAASSDSWILDRCNGWINAAAEIIRSQVPAAWIVDLR